MAKPLIGSSQARYLLPIYILSLPLAVYFTNWFLSLIKREKLRLILGIMAILAVLVLSANAVLFNSEESLFSVMKTVKNYHEINKEVIKITEEKLKK